MLSLALIPTRTSNPNDVDERGISSKLCHDVVFGRHFHLAARNSRISNKRCYACVTPTQPSKQTYASNKSISLWARRRTSGTHLRDWPLLPSARSIQPRHLSRVWVFLNAVPRRPLSSTSSDELDKIDHRLRAETTTSSLGSRFALSSQNISFQCPVFLFISNHKIEPQPPEPFCVVHQVYNHKIISLTESSRTKWMDKYVSSCWKAERERDLSVWWLHVSLSSSAILQSFIAAAVISLVVVYLNSVSGKQLSIVTVL